MEQSPLLQPGLSYGFTHIGRKDNQEDRLYPPLTAEVSTAEGSLFIVCDGVGGRACGEVASDTVCQAFGQFFTEHSVTDEELTEDRFREALSYAYDRLDQVAQERQAEEMATTLVLACFHSGGCFIAHIGDSRAYLIRPSDTYRVKFFTSDHSFAQLLRQQGADEEEIVRHPMRHAITRAMRPLQGGERCEADQINLKEELQEGDYIFLCSDGVLEKVNDVTLADVLGTDKTDEEKMRQIERLCEGSYDNYSAWLIPIKRAENKKCPWWKWLWK